MGLLSSILQKKLSKWEMETSSRQEPGVGPVGCITDLQPDLASTFTLVDVFPTLYSSFSISSSVMLKEESLSF